MPEKKAAGTKKKPKKGRRLTDEELPTVSGGYLAAPSGGPIYGVPHDGDYDVRRGVPTSTPKR